MLTHQLLCRTLHQENSVFLSLQPRVQFSVGIKAGRDDSECVEQEEGHRPCDEPLQDVSDERKVGTAKALNRHVARKAQDPQDFREI